MVRRCQRVELGVPPYAKNTDIQAAAMHNTLDEKTNTHNEAQHHRLTTSTQGRAILRDLGYDIKHLPDIPPAPPPWDSIPNIKVLPVPKNMNADSHPGRRQARANHLATPDNDTYYVDAAHTPEKTTTAVVGPRNETIRSHAAVPSPIAAEIQAITEAVCLHTHNTDTITIRTDCQGALRAFTQNILPDHTRTTLTKYMHKHPTLQVLLEWIPGHQGIEGNERAHALARDHLTPSNPTRWPETYCPREARAEHRKQRRARLKEAKVNRLLLPSPSHTHTREDAALIRQAQTLTLPNDAIQHHIENRSGKPVCQVCGGYPNAFHTYWECPRALSSPHILTRSHIPPSIPYSWESWTVPPQELRPTLWPLLVAHIKHIRGSCQPDPAPQPGVQPGSLGSDDSD